MNEQFSSHVLGLGDGIPLCRDFEPMGWFQWTFGLWVNRPFDIAVFNLMNSSEEVKVAFPMPLLSE